MEDKPMEDKPMEDKPMEDKPMENATMEDIIMEDTTIENTTMEEEIKDLICPITLKIFREPCVASDGFIYEKTYIERWFKTNDTSPTTNVKMDNMNIVSCNYIKQKIKNLYEKYPQLYSSEYHNNEIFEEHVISISEFMSVSNIKNTIDYNQFKKLIDNSSLDELNETRVLNMNMIHFICCFGTNQMIKYIIDKGVNLECQSNIGIRPIHLICRYLSSEIIKYIIDKGVNLECKTTDGIRPIHFICQYSSSEMVKYIIDKGVNLECKTNDGIRPIHLICQYSTPEMIKYIIDKKVILDCKTNEGFKPIHAIRQYSTPEMQQYLNNEMNKNILYTYNSMKNFCINLFNIK